MLKKIYEVGKKTSIVFISLTEKFELVYLKTNIKTSKLIIENIVTKKPVFSTWIGFIAQFFLTENIITFLEYDGTVIIFDIEKRQIVKKCKPNKKIEKQYKMVSSYINNGVIIYSGNEAYFVDVSLNEYTKFDFITNETGLNSINVMEKDKRIIFCCPGNNMYILDYDMNLIYDSTKSDKIKKKDYDYLLGNERILNLSDKCIISHTSNYYLNSYLLVKNGKDIKNIDNNWQDLKFLLYLKKSIVNEKYYYMLTVYSNCIYIFDSVTDKLLRRLKINSAVSDVLLNDSLKVIVFATVHKITAFRFDDIYDFINYSK